jgi:uncharacterized protein YaaW (UPF0174 family)
MTNNHLDIELINVLKTSSSEDLGILIDTITGNGEGRLSLSNDVKTKLMEYKMGLQGHTSTYLLIATEIQKFGGNSLINLFRGKGVSYREIVCDVANHVGANYNDKNDIAQIESTILLKIIESSLDQMSDDEKISFFDQFGVKYIKGAGPLAMASLIAAIQLTGFATYKLAAIVAQATAKALLGKGLAFGATGGLMKGISVFSGPIGWAITGVWTAFDLASPAYRVTVPCVIQLAYMRQKQLISVCTNCKAPVTNDMKFCSECDHKLGEI